MTVQPHAALDIPVVDPAAIPPVDYAAYIRFAEFLWNGVTYLYYAMFGW